MGSIVKRLTLHYQLIKLFSPSQILIKIVPKYVKWADFTADALTLPLP
jgi:hypothetical protein